MVEQCVDIRIVLLPHYRLYKRAEADNLLESIKASGGDETEKIHHIEYDGKLEENLYATLDTIDKNKEKDAILVLCGSVFIMEGIRDLFKIPQTKDADNKCLD